MEPTYGDPSWLRSQLGIALDVAALGAAAARAAGLGVRSEQGRDIKIDADFATDRRVHEELARRSPIPILSEERTSSAAATGPRWIVDPVDGSMNFTRQIPFCGVSIALWHGMTPLLGVIHDLSREEVFSGIVQHGAWLNGRPIRVSEVADRGRAILCSGLPTASVHGTAKLNAFLARAEAYKKLRALGSAALMLAYVACGRCEAYAEDGIAIWDVAAGLAIVSAAGGRFSMVDTGVPDRYDVEATNAALKCV
ncbi:MAG TPA: inositol monophosphatase family protein [Vicinamibacterales bacterium]|nr:inositol monophosphatase family protein [Vicinamibacterales bacterium]